MKCANAINLDRKSGGTLGRTWGTRSVPSDLAMTQTPEGRVLTQILIAQPHGRAARLAIPYAELPWVRYTQPCARE